MAAEKAAGAFLTIGELAEQLGLPQHILRYWETRFPQLRPLQRAGKRRYYRPEDVALTKRIHSLLNEQGYTIKGVQKLLSGRGAEPVVEMPRPVPASAPASNDLLPALRQVRAELAAALAEA